MISSFTLLSQKTVKRKSKLLYKSVEVCLGPSKRPMMDFFAEIAHGWKALAIFEKSSMVDVGKDVWKSGISDFCDSFTVKLYTVK